MGVRRRQNNRTGTRGAGGAALCRKPSARGQSGEGPRKAPARQGTLVLSRLPFGNASRPGKGVVVRAAARPGAGAKEGKGKSCTIRFYAELNDFLPPGRRQVAFRHFFSGRPTVKDLIEGLGVPHTEVDLILVSGESVDFGRHIEDGDLISVYPVFESLDISPVSRVRSEPLRRPRFVLDGHLGRLAAYLRLVGFDALYERDLADETLVRLSREERRILLTRDRGLLKRSQVTHGYLVRKTEPRRQLAEVLQRFDLWRAARPFSRCLRCNGELVATAKEEVADRLPPKVRERCREFSRCRGCGRVYWKGSHYDRLARLIQEIRDREGAG